MLKVLLKIKNKLERFYVKLALWLEDLEERNFRNVTPPTAITRNAVQASYEEGLRKIKNKVKQQGETQKEIEEFLEQNKETLLTLAENEDNKKEIELLKRALIFKHKDIKNDNDLENMIERRIRDFKELQKHKLQRQKLRELRNQNGRLRKD